MINEFSGGRGIFPDYELKANAGATIQLENAQNKLIGTAKYEHSKEPFLQPSWSEKVGIGFKKAGLAAGLVLCATVSVGLCPLVLIGYLMTRRAGQLVNKYLNDPCLPVNREAAKKLQKKRAKHIENLWWVGVTLAIPIFGIKPLLKAAWEGLDTPSSLVKAEKYALSLINPKNSRWFLVDVNPKLEKFKVQTAKLSKNNLIKLHTYINTLLAKEVDPMSEESDPKLETMRKNILIYVVDELKRK